VQFGSLLLLLLPLLLVLRAIPALALLVVLLGVGKSGHSCSSCRRPPAALGRRWGIVSLLFLPPFLLVLMLTVQLDTTVMLSLLATFQLVLLPAFVCRVVVVVEFLVDLAPNNRTRTY